MIVNRQPQPPHLNWVALGSKIPFYFVIRQYQAANRFLVSEH
jgi:hypothetical protein